MPIFQITGQALTPVQQRNFDREKELQALIEANLEPVFNGRFVATEFSTGSVHAGRIDTLALSEDINPVIIEYKKVESSELINQSLFNLHWLQDHRGDFEIAVQQSLGPDAAVDWSAIRVLCIAPNYKKYNILAVQVMGAYIRIIAMHKLRDRIFRSFDQIHFTRDNLAGHSESAQVKTARQVSRVEPHLMPSCLHGTIDELRHTPARYVVNFQAGVPALW